MDQFGVQKTSLKAIAKTPVIPELKISYDKPSVLAKTTKFFWMEAELKEPKGDEMSAFGVGFDDGGVLFSMIAENSFAAKMGFRTGDLLQGVNNIKVKTIQQLKDYISTNKTGAKKHIFTIVRNQIPVKITINQPLELIIN